jgi:hypothetical protein
VDVALLRSISIICHRGLSLGRTELMNSYAAIDHSWLFGCSGVELDVTLPHAGGDPLVDQLRVYHAPEWKSEIFSNDAAEASTVQSAPDLDTALRRTYAASVPLVYLDPKLRWWLRRDQSAARAALTRIVTMAVRHTAATNQTIIVGSETSGPGEAADMLTDLRRRHPGALWALEITRGTDVDSARARLESSDSPGGPDIASFNLFAVPGGGGGFFRVFVPTVTPELEASLARRSQPLVYWTAHDTSQFDAVLSTIRRIRPTNVANAAIITPFPHRLAFHLAAASAE